MPKANTEDGLQQRCVTTGIALAQSANAMKEIDFAILRNEMVDNQIAGRGIRSPRVLDAMRRVHREDFLPERLGARKKFPRGSASTVRRVRLVRPNHCGHTAIDCRAQGGP
jgi:hypothetical protein